MNNWFNIKRFWLVLRHEFTSVWIEIAIFAAMFPLSYIIAQTNSLTGKALPLLFAAAFILYQWALPARVFANMKSGTQCISYLTLPASNAEKFYARLLIYWLLPTLLFLLSCSPALTPEAYRNHVVYNTDLVISVGVILMQSNAAVLFGTLFRRFGLPLLLLFEALLLVSVIVISISARDITDNLNFEPAVSIVEYVGTEVDNDLSFARLKQVVAAFVCTSAVVNIGLARILFSRKRLRRAMLNTNVE